MQQRRDAMYSGQAGISSIVMPFNFQNLQGYNEAGWRVVI